MTDKENAAKMALAGKVIAEFLAQNAHPDTVQWKGLIATNEDLASYIVDAVVVNSGVCSLSEEDLDSPVDMAAFSASVSNAVNLVHSTPSPLAARIEQQVALVRGPTVRKAANELGLGSVPMLLSSILVGTVRAPKLVLLGLAERFETSALALERFFQEAFASQSVPAYKAEHGKPTVALEPTAWADAVKSLNLPSEQAAALLALDE